MHLCSTCLLLADSFHAGFCENVSEDRRAFRIIRGDRHPIPAPSVVDGSDVEVVEVGGWGISAPLFASSACLGLNFADGL